MEKSTVVALGETLVGQVLSLGVHGRGPLKGAVEVAEEHLAGEEGDVESAARRLVATHTGLAAASGFVTGLGGIVTLPVSVPAALVGRYLLAGRMTAGIAHLRGHDVGSAAVHSTVLVCLLGDEAAAVLEAAGVETGRSVAAALRRVPHRTLTEIDRHVGHRLVAQAGDRGMLNLAKLVPLLGGPVGAAADSLGCRAVAAYALRAFESLPRPVAGEIVEGEVVYVRPPG